MMIEFGSKGKQWISKKVYLAKYLTFAAMIFSKAALAQNGFSDGGFDVQGSQVGSYCYFVSGCPAGVWVGSGSAALSSSGYEAWGSVIANTPNTFAAIQKDAVLSQTFVAQQSGLYMLVWYEADRPFAGGQTYDVQINGVSVGNFHPTDTVFKPQRSTQFSMQAGTSYTIAFRGLAVTEDKSSLIDSVKLVGTTSTSSYTYDGLGRLLSVKNAGGANDGWFTQYTLDKAGNRIKVGTSN